MNAVDTLRLFSDGRMSAHDTRALMVSMGFTEQDFAEALFALLQEGGTLRVSKWDKTELQADLFLIASEA